MSTIFSKIISGEISAYKIAEDDNYLAFLDIMPLVKGHVLVIPKEEVDYIFDIDDDILAGLMIFAKKVSKAIDKAVPCKRVGVAVIGLEVPHSHIHLVPLNNIDDINFTRPKLSLSEQEMVEIQERIIHYLG